MQTTKEVNSYPCIVPRINMWNVSFFFFILFLIFNATCWIVGAWIFHIAHEGQVGGWYMKMDHV